MSQSFMSLVKLTFARPREAAAQVFEQNFERRALWLAMALVAVVSVLANEFTILFVPDEMINNNGPVPSSPLNLAVLIWGMLALTVFATHYIGRAFGGQGRFDDSLKTVIWMQLVMLVLQALQIVMFMMEPVAAIIFGLVGGVYMLGVYLMFVQVLHGFQTMGGVALGAFIGFIGVAIVLGMVMIVISKLFGLELPAHV